MSAVDSIVFSNSLQNLFFKAGHELNLFDDANGAIVSVFRRERKPEGSLSELLKRLKRFLE
jgi:hypothetical protein